jgi:hypothetical protein
MARSTERALRNDRHGLGGHYGSCCLPDDCDRNGNRREARRRRKRIERRVWRKAVQSDGA